MGQALIAGGVGGVTGTVKGIADQLWVDDENDGTIETEETLWDAGTGFLSGTISFGFTDKLLGPVFKKLNKSDYW